MLLLAKVCKPTRCSSTGYQYSELLFFSCLFSGQLKLHNGVLGAGIIDYIPATFTNSDTPSTNNAFLLKATFFYIQDNTEEHITTIRSEAERVINRTLPVCRPLTEVRPYLSNFLHKIEVDVLAV